MIQYNDNMLIQNSINEPEDASKGIRQFLKNGETIKFTD